MAETILLHLVRQTRQWWCDGIATPYNFWTMCCGLYKITALSFKRGDINAVRLPTRSILSRSCIPTTRAYPSLRPLRGSLRLGDISLRSGEDGRHDARPLYAISVSSSFHFSFRVESAKTPNLPSLHVDTLAFSLYAQLHLENAVRHVACLHTGKASLRINLPIYGLSPLSDTTSTFFPK